MKEKADEYFSRNIASPLREIIFKLYEDYSARPDKEENFEHFFLAHFMERLPR
jgi:hypothetical protein